MNRVDYHGNPMFHVLNCCDDQSGEDICTDFTG